MKNLLLLFTLMFLTASCASVWERGGKFLKSLGSASTYYGKKAIGVSKDVRGTVKVVGKNVKTVNKELKKTGEELEVIFKEVKLDFEKELEEY